MHTVGQFGEFANQLQIFLPRTLLQHRANIFKQAARRERTFIQLQLAGLDLREIKHHVDHFEQMLAGGFQLAQPFALIGRQTGAAHQERHAADGIEWCPDFMAHIGQEGAF